MSKRRSRLKKLTSVIKKTVRPQGLKNRLKSVLDATKKERPIDHLQTVAQSYVNERRFRKICETTIEMMAHEIGVRNIHTPNDYMALDRCLVWLCDELDRHGFKERHIQSFVSQHHEVSNLIVEVPGTDRKLKDEIIVIGAHYDSSPGCPGANDNASGVAAVLALASFFQKHRQKRTLRFAFFVNEEPPLFNTEDMGSYQYAKACHDRNEKIVAMITPDTIGYYSSEPDSQYIPEYAEQLGIEIPSVGDFLAVVGATEMAPLVTLVSDHLNDGGFKTLPFVLPAPIPGVSWSDHASFWKMGYPAVMLTDTALYRFDGYHNAGDTASQLNYRALGAVVEAFRHCVQTLANGDLPEFDATLVVA